ncbi:MAG: hypothetical protein E7183_02230 [Erysipelotrichaceae bacterium]|nr:hypothetical protein [Erysipelotrichaceae bacterium]
MDLKQAEQVLYKLLKKEWEFDVESEIREDWLVFTANLTAKGIDDGIFFKVGVSNDDAFYIQFVLDKIDFSSYVCKLIYDYNANSNWLHCYVREDEYLVVEYAIRYISLDTLENNVSFMLSEFIDEENMNYLKPLSELTHPVEE